jgi:hypothetical protein
LIVFVSSGIEAQTLRCGDKVVSAGDTKAEVVMKCGEPAGKDSHSEEIIEKIDENAKRKVKVTVTIDEWTYNLGPDTLIRILTFTNGKLVNIREGGYGSVNPRTPETRCDERYPDIGATKAEVQLKCGDPSWKENRTEEILENIDAETKRKVTVSIEEWTYNFGPGKLIRIFRFKNNRLVNVKTGGYGN